MLLAPAAAVVPTLVRFTLFPAATNTKFPFVAVIFPRVAVKVVAEVIDPAVVVMFPAVATIFPVVAAIPVPAVTVVPAASVVVAAIDPGAKKVEGIDRVIVLPAPVVVICDPVPDKVMLFAAGVIAPPESAVKVFKAPPETPSVVQTADKTPPKEVKEVSVLSILDRVLIQRLPKGKFTSEVEGALVAIKGTSTFSGCVPTAIPYKLAPG
jgi:hypothetical protein